MDQLDEPKCASHSLFFGLMTAGYVHLTGELQEIKIGFMSSGFGPTESGHRPASRSARVRPPRRRKVSERFRSGRRPVGYPNSVLAPSSDARSP